MNTIYDWYANLDAISAVIAALFITAIVAFAVIISMTVEHFFDSWDLECERDRRSNRSETTGWPADSIIDSGFTDR